MLHCRSLAGAWRTFVQCIQILRYSRKYTRISHPGKTQGMRQEYYPLRTICHAFQLVVSVAVEFWTVWWHTYTATNSINRPTMRTAHLKNTAVPTAWHVSDTSTQAYQLTMDYVRHTVRWISCLWHVTHGRQAEEVQCGMLQRTMLQRTNATTNSFYS
jgi:hypothetical protein